MHHLHVVSYETIGQLRWTQKETSVDSYRYLISPFSKKMKQNFKAMNKDNTYLYVGFSKLNPFLMEHI
jgi:hypothetical protein